MTIVSFTSQKRSEKSQNPENRATQILHAMMYGRSRARSFSVGEIWPTGCSLPDGTLKKDGKDGWQLLDDSDRSSPTTMVESPLGPP